MERPAIEDIAEALQGMQGDPVADDAKVLLEYALALEARLVEVEREKRDIDAALRFCKRTEQSLQCARERQREAETERDALRARYEPSRTA